MQRPLSIKDYVRTTSRAYTLAMVGDKPHTNADCEVTEYFKKSNPPAWDASHAPTSLDSGLTVSVELYSQHAQ